ncbi:uncharacterized protein BT62DRAFT_410134 [Guyanagaster necrorhizus]|uniref:Uncharacterized protein n=1 Tax=Guyanagaster necrorhizus TaxID=856835 RepID=A0A9P7W320_9AGAR|nr:uncharacterized protein BT62DRAFT_410134 [Guyanagaster necrorhizus MCA 3950]KAG7451257.1 hypothetical protein BT62DRAFT_410134 [Guyanagaster necrorhizus MCA 3950]
MFSTFLTFALVLNSIFNGVLADFTVYAPSAVPQCGLLSISWDSTAMPIDAVLVNPQDPCGNSIQDFGSNNWGNSLNATVIISAGTSIQVSLVDSNDDEAWSGVITVTESGDASCLSGDGVPSSSVSDVSVTSSTISTASGPTLVVTPGSNAKASSTSSATSADPSAPVGAVGSGSGSNGASRQVAAPLVILGAMFTGILLSL